MRLRRRHGWHIFHRITVVVGVLVEFQYVFHQLFLGFMDVEYRHAGQLELRTVACQYNCFSFPGEKESIVLHINLCGNEIMGIHIRRIVHQFTELMEGAYGCHRNHFLQYSFQAETGQGVCFYNGYFGLMIHFHVVLVND